MFIGFRDITMIRENKMDKSMEHETENGMVQGFRGFRE